MTTGTNMTSRTITAAIALVVGLLAVAESGSAQVDVLPGQRIRATMNNGGLVTGTVVSISADSLTINTGAAFATPGFGQVVATPGASGVMVPIDRIAKIEVSRGRSSGLLKGAMYGGIGGGGLGLIIAASNGCCYVGATLGMAVVGAGNGLWIGHFWLSGEDWVVQYGGLDMDLVLAPSPQGGVSVGLSFPMGR